MHIFFLNPNSSLLSGAALELAQKKRFYGILCYIELSSCQGFYKQISLVL